MFVKEYIFISKPIPGEHFTFSLLIKAAFTTHLMFLQHFKGLSFPTISSVGPNAAIIHYSPEADTCAELDADKIYLCDSGAPVEYISVLNCFSFQTS